MNKIKKFVTLCAVLFLFTLGSQAVFAESMDEGAVKDMANMVIHLNHHPTDDEKARLQEIIDDGSLSDAVHTIASAMLNMEHRVSAQDKEKLGTIAQDSNVDEDVRTLATAVRNIEHHASDNDKEMLKKIIGE